MHVQVVERDLDADAMLGTATLECGEVRLMIESDAIDATASLLRLRNGAWVEESRGSAGFFPVRWTCAACCRLATIELAILRLLVNASGVDGLGYHLDACHAEWNQLDGKHAPH